MATLQIQVAPSESVKRYKLAIDNKRVKMRADNSGVFSLSNFTCGDGSKHKLGYAIHGPTGAKLAIKMTCDGGAQIQIPDVEVFPEVEPLGGGTVEFTL